MPAYPTSRSDTEPRDEPSSPPTLCLRVAPQSCAAIALIRRPPHDGQTGADTSRAAARGQAEAVNVPRISDSFDFVAKADRFCGVAPTFQS